MKKLTGLFLPIACLLVLSACSSGQAKTTDSSTKETTEVKQVEKNEEQAIFTGTLSEDVQVDGETLRLSLKEIEAIHDPENILKSMKNDGVILNAKEDLVKNVKKEELKSGVKVKFTLKKMAIMTMSLPPQIPGNSIVSIEKD